MSSNLNAPLTWDTIQAFVSSIVTSAIKSLHDMITDHEKRIADLEKRIADLEVDAVLQKETDNRAS